MKQRAIAAPLVAVILFSSCGGSSEEGSDTTVANNTTTTLDTGNLSITQNLRPLVPTEAVIAPPLVSETAGAQDADKSEISPSEVARQEELLRELDAQRNQEGIVLTIPELVLFDFNSAELRPDAEPQIQKVVELMRFYPQSNVTVAGHTDSVGSNDQNQQLSERRAQAVLTALVNAGAPASRLSAEGFGEEQPITSNTSAGGADDPEGRQRNRRVEITFEGA